MSRYSNLWGEVKVKAARGSRNGNTDGDEDATALVKEISVKLSGNKYYDRLKAQLSSQATTSQKAETMSAFGGSLFGGLNASSQAQQTPGAGSTSLFGSLNATSSQPAKSLFGTTSSAPQSTSLFGASTSAPQSTSLFGSLGGAGGQAPAAATTSAAAPPKLGGSLFGSLGSTQTQQPSQGASLFGLGSSQMPQATAQQQPQQQQQQSTDQGLNQVAGSRPAYFDGLLQRSKLRRMDNDDGHGLDSLPNLQLGLGDISRRARELGGSGSAPLTGRKPGDSKAHYLLAASGIAPGSALRDLKDFNASTAPGAAPADAPPPAVDVDSYVANLHARTSQIMIEEALAQSARDFEKFLDDNVTMNWDEQRRKIYEHFGLATKNDRVDDMAGAKESGSFGKSRRQARSQSRANTPGASRASTRLGKSTLGKSILGAPSIAGQALSPVFADVIESSASIAPTADRFQQQKQSDFADQVRLLNDARSKGDLYPLLHNFAKVEEKSEVDQGNIFVETYKALIQIIKEKPELSRPSERGSVPERHYAIDYLDETPNSAKSIKMKKRIIDGSRTHLEKQFFHQMEVLIAKNQREARLGGVPTVLNKIRAYANIRAGRKDLAPEAAELQMIGEDNCWVVVFFLLRSGHLKEATEYVTSNAPAFRAIDRNFATYITNYYNSEDRRLKHDLQARIDAEYNQRTRIAPENTMDPFRMACYKIIGRCELSKRNLDRLGGGVEDWMWLQFSLARESNRISDPEPFGLDEVRVTIKEIGQRHFSKGGDSLGSYGTFFRLQILGGLFEQAISFLYPFSYLSAVHFAIALEYYGLLRVSDMSSPEVDLISYSTKQLPQICFGRMLGYYTRDFRSVAAAPAADYLTLICLSSTPDGPLAQSYTNLCHAALRDLILETREYSTLLGDMRADGSRIPGAIERHLSLIHLEDKDEFLRNVTIQAASAADDSGRTTDAVLLYHLAEDYENVTTILNRALSEAIAVDIGQDSLRLQPLKPRVPAQQQPNNSQAPPGSSLSLMAVDDPEQLAANMIGLYNSNAMFYRKISAANRTTCGVLIQMSRAKALVALQKWAESLDRIADLNILPLNAGGSIPVIRTSAQSFASLAPPIARNIGPLLMWTITCCGKQREILRGGSYADRTRNEMANALLTRAKDCMVFAGLIKYKLTERVYDMLAQAAGEGDAF